MEVLVLRILVIGGAGFIGSALVRHLIADRGHEVLVLDALTYAAVPGSLAAVEADPRYGFVQADVADASAVKAAIERFRPQAIAHLAAESHVDRSIDGPAEFIRTNIVGAFVMLEQALAWWRGLPDGERERFRFLHISTDEVFGSLGDDGRFDETTAYDPRSPYAASKASSDHLVRAWGHTFGLPVLVTNCSNNYGPRQYPEKLIPLLILRALAGTALPIYGDGGHVRDWLHVEDHARALGRVLERGVAGRTYNIGGEAERTTLQVAHAVCDALDRLAPRADGAGHASRIALVIDRPGHDRRYAIDATRIETELGWRPTVEFKDGIEGTVCWYLENRTWWEGVLEASEAMRRRGLG